MQRWLAMCVVLCLIGAVRGDEPPVRGDAPPKAPTSGQPTMEDLEAFAKLIDRDLKDRPEWVEMAVAIFKNRSMGSGQGWYKPASKRFDWEWIAKAFPEAADDHVIEPGEVPEFDATRFSRLDRTRDGYFSKTDLTWSKNPIMSGFGVPDAIFQLLDTDNNGRLEKTELDEWFRKTGGGFDFLTMEDMRNGLQFTPPRGSGGGRPSQRQDQRLVALRRLLNGELGSLTEGPQLGQPAPELNLPLLNRSADGASLELTDRFVKLDEFRGKKPVVLIFGSFT